MQPRAQFTNVISIAAYLSRPSSDPSSPEPQLTARPDRPTSRRSRRTRASSLEGVHDDEVVERLALGDIDAAEALRARYIDRLQRAATLILGDEGEVARVVESALEEACCGWPPERGQVERWLTRLVRRAAFARKRALWGLDGAHSAAARRQRYQHARSSRH